MEIITVRQFRAWAHCYGSITDNDQVCYVYLQSCIYVQYELKRLLTQALLTAIERQKESERRNTG